MTFKAGDPGGPGRPKKPIEEKYIKAVYSAIKPDDLKEIVETLSKAAKRGDVQAAKLLMSYLVGIPVQKIAPTTPDGQNPYMSMDSGDLIAIAKKIADAGSDE